MYFEGLAGGCADELAIDVAFLDEEGGVVELAGRRSVGIP